MFIAPLTPRRDYRGLDDGEPTFWVSEDVNAKSKKCPKARAMVFPSEEMQSPVSRNMQRYKECVALHNVLPQIPVAPERVCSATKSVQRYTDVIWKSKESCRATKSVQRYKITSTDCNNYLKTM